MYVLSNFLLAIAKVGDFVLTALYWLIIIRALVSWVNPDPFNPIVQFLYGATEPLLRPLREPLRRLLPGIPIDFSPLAVFLIIVFLRVFIIQSLVDQAYRLKY